VTLSAFLRKLNPIARHNTLCGACPLRAQPREYNESILSGPQVTPNSETLCGGKALHIVWLNYRGAGEPKYNVGFSDYASTQVAKIHREIVTEHALRKFLTEQIKIHPDSVAVAIKRLRAEGNTAIFHTPLTDTELSTLGLS
jgi:hypothetical protein